MEIDLYSGFLSWRALVEIAQGLKNVTNICTTRDQHPQRTVGMTGEGVLLEEVSCRSESPMLKMTDLVDELHFKYI